MHTIATQLQTLRNEVNAAFKEREDAVEAVLLAILCKEHVFVLGLPGTAKTLMLKAIVNAFVGANHFECQMSKTRSADAVLGPLDILEFRNNGHLWRKDKGFLTTADFATIDEIGKMSSVLGHDLLAAFNERVKHQVNGGRSVHAIPLMTAFASSNEVPTEESEDAAALWDRLLVRVIVEQIKSGKNFAAMLTGGNPLDKVTTKIDFADLKQAIEVDVPQVKIGDDVVKAIMVLRKKLSEKGVEPSARRWRQSMKLLQAAAFLDGRSEVTEEDLAVLRFTLWDTIPQIEDITKLASSASNPYVERLLKAKAGLQEIGKGIDERKDKSSGEKADYAKEISPKLNTVRDQLDALLDEANGRTIPNFVSVSDLHKSLMIRVYSECFGLEPDVAEAAIKSKLGKGSGVPA